jgi:PAS domain S-box-containing protein
MRMSIGTDDVRMGTAATDGEHAVLSAVFDATSDAIIVTRLSDGRVIDVNDAFLRLFGHERSEVLGRTTSEFGLWIDPTHREDIVRRLRKHGSLADICLQLRTRSGEIRSIEASAQVVDVEGVPCIVAIDRDVTERKRIQDALVESEVRHRKIVETLQEGLWIIDAENQTTSVNQKMAEMLGYTAEEMIGRSMFDFMDEQGQTSATGYIEHLQRGISGQHDRRLRRKDGSELWAILNTGALQDENGAYAGAFASVVDITDRRRAEHELQRALEAEQAAAARLRALDEMKNTFLNAVSHELRTPLASVLGSALTLQRLGDQIGEEDQRELLEAVVTNAKRLRHLMTDLLDLDRLTRGVVRLRVTPEELGGLVLRIVESGDHSAGRTVHIETHPMVLPVDAPKVERIIENLIANAIKYSPEDSPIWVKVVRIPEGAMITVEDCGDGVPAEARTAVFEPFYQAQNRDTHTPGVGIGLSLVARFAELHGGRAWVEERPGGGASFRVILRDPTAPRLRSPEPAHAEASLIA